MSAATAMDTWALLLMAWVAGLLPIAYNFFTPRRFWDTFELMSDSVLPWARLLRISAIMLFLLCAGVGWLLSRGERGKWPPAVWLAAMVYNLSLIASMAFGGSPGFSVSAILFPVALFALLPVSRSPSTRVALIQAARAVVGIYTYGSLAAAVIAPHYAVETGYSGLISVRLHGLTTHANSLAALAALFLCIEWLRQSKGIWGQINRLVALAVIFLAQSKAVWLVLLLALPVVVGFRLSGLKRASALTIFLGILLALSLYAVATPQYIRQMLEDPNIVTLTGRTPIWEYTVQVWRQFPWFGYGYASFWDESMRLAFATAYNYRWIPGYAHNQWYQTLGQAGIVGVAGLIQYTVCLVVRMIRLCNSSRGVSLILGMLLLLRGITEVTLSNDLVSEAFFLHFIILGLLLAPPEEVTGCAERDPLSRPAPAPLRDLHSAAG